MDINTLSPVGYFPPLAIMDCMIRQTMCLNGVLNGMVSATMQNRQSTIQRDQCQGLCVSHAVVLGIILRIACEFLAVLKSIQPACLTMLNFVVSKLYLSLLSFPLFTYLPGLKANSDHHHAPLIE